MQKSGFKPVVAGKPKVLILGSMPSEASLAQQQYYAYAHNAFWPIMAELFGFAVELDYVKRTKELTKNRIALWDVIEQCKREGSLDTSIQSESIIVNDFKSLFAKYHSIQHVIFNGQKAQQEFRRRVLTELSEFKPDLKYYVMPSTSPANARLRFADKLQAWSIIKELIS